MIINKKRINSLSILKNIDIGKEIIICIRNAERFEKQYKKLGFNKLIENGQTILPKVVNPTTRRNAETYYVPDRTKPKETAYRRFWFKRRQWSGRGETTLVEDFVLIPYKRYPRNKYSPYSVELITKLEDDKTITIYSKPILFNEDNFDLIKNTINIFLTQFGECEILDEDFESYKKQKLVHLNWKLLPPGKHPWEKVKNDIGEISKNTTKTNRQSFTRNTEILHNFNPEFIAYGQAGFNGYVVFGYPDKNLYVLESYYPNNATYIFSKDWENISKCSKAEILNGNLQEHRFIHNNNWNESIKQILK